MKKSVLVLLLSAGFSVATVAVAQTPQQTQATRPAPFESIEASEQLTVHSKVVNINKAERIITVQLEDGTKLDVSFGKNLDRFNKIKVGDQFTANLSRSILIDLDSSVSNAVGTVTSTVTSRTTQGSNVNTSVGQTVAFNTEVARLNLNDHTVTFVNPNGTSHTVTVTNPRLQARLANLQQGQRIRVRINSTFDIADAGRA